MHESGSNKSLTFLHVDGIRLNAAKPVIGKIVFRIVTLFCILILEDADFVKLISWI